MPGQLLGALRRRATYAGAARELVSVLRCATRYPTGLRAERIPVALSHPPAGRPAPAAPPRAGWPGAGHSTPVVLVHGFAHNHSGWWVMRRHLRQAGFDRLDSFNYLPLRTDIPAAARQLGDRIARLRRVTGADRVHIVGHSLGGLVARWLVQELGADGIDTVVTLGTPHEGTLAAWAAPGRTASQLRPGSWVIKRLQQPAAPSPVRWVAFHSNVDELIAPSRSAMLRHPDLRALNILAKDHGHMSLMTSPLVATAVVRQLEVAEGTGGLASITGLPVDKPALRPADDGIRRSAAAAAGGAPA